MYAYCKYIVSILYVYCIHLMTFLDLLFECPADRLHISTEVPLVKLVPAAQQFLS